MVNRAGIGLSHADTFQIQMIEFLTVNEQSLEKHLDCIKLKTTPTTQTMQERNYVIKFTSSVEAEKWFMFLKLAIARDHHERFEKWKSTRIVCTQGDEKASKKQRLKEDINKDILVNILEQLKQKPNEVMKSNFKTKTKSK